MSTCASNLETAVTSAIAQNPHLIRRQLRIETDNGHVVLKGSVRSYYQKQMAQELLRGVEGIATIENQLEVTWN